MRRLRFLLEKFRFPGQSVKIFGVYHGCLGKRIRFIVRVIDFYVLGSNTISKGILTSLRFPFDI